MLEPQHTTTARVTARVAAGLKELSRAVEDRLSEMDERELPRRFFERDPSIWADEPEVQRRIQPRLGWIDLERDMRDDLDDLAAWVSELHEKGARHGVMLGMGASSSCARMLKQALYEGAPNIELTVLDSADPATIRGVEGAIRKPSEALFLVSSKSGSTPETMALLRHFEEKYPPEQFVAITAPGSPLEKRAEEAGFESIFHGPSDLGGRFGALSMRGLVPAALMGLKLRRLLDRVRAMRTACAAEGRKSRERPAFWLGAVLAEAMMAGRDKLTLALSPEIEGMGPWLETLVAKSTGMKGLGLLPVEGEPLGAPEVYGADRLFVHLRLPGDAGGKMERRVDALEAAGHPVIRFYLDDPYDIGAEMLRWQIATAVAAAIVGVNPFEGSGPGPLDDARDAFLERLESTGSFTEPTPHAREGSLELYGDDELRGLAVDGVLGDWLSAHLRRVQPGDYVAVSAYLPESPEVDKALRRIQAKIRDKTKAATTVGYGPGCRYATARLHEEGPNRGVFILLTAEPDADLAIPGASYGFGALARALALGDEGALRAAGRRVVRCHLGPGPAEAGLKTLSRRIG